MILIKGDKLNNKQINLLYNLHRDVGGYSKSLDEF